MDRNGNGDDDMFWIDRTKIDYLTDIMVERHSQQECSQYFYSNAYSDSYDSRSEMSSVENVSVMMDSVGKRKCFHNNSRHVMCIR